MYSSKEEILEGIKKEGVEYVDKETGEVFLWNGKEYAPPAQG